MNYRIIDFKVFGDERGKLISLEEPPYVPFDIKRVYYIFDTHPDQIRGRHAHMDLEQVVVAMDGSCEFILDDGYEKKNIWLNRPDIGLYIGKKMWREMRNFSYGCKLMILASDKYNENEYLRDYSLFIDKVRNNRK